MTAYYIVVAEFFQSRAGIALLASVIGGLVATAIWAELFHWLLRLIYHPHFTGADRVPWIARVSGALERLLLSILTLWLPQALGPIAGALIIVKAVLGWGDLKGDTLEGRIRYHVSLMNGLFSITWAMAWGIWGMPQSN